MIQEALKYVADLAHPPETMTINDRTFTTKPVHPVEDPLQAKETVSTLTGLVDLVKANLNGFEGGQCFIHVASPTQVFLEDLMCDDWGKRQYHIEAKLPNYGRFAFDTYMDQERFIIGVQAFFTKESPDLEYVLKIAGALKADAVSESDDDGISQRAAVRSGVHLAENVTIKRRVVLHPYRTFREINQPSSDFIFRLKSQNGEIPTLALFTADGEMWQSTAMQDIKSWLKGHLGLPVVA